MLLFPSPSVVAVGLVFAVGAVGCCVDCHRQLPSPIAVAHAQAPATPDAKVYTALLDKALSGSRGKVILSQDSAGFAIKEVSYSYLFPAPNAAATASPDWAPRGSPHIAKKTWQEATDSFRLRNMRSVKLPPLNLPNPVSLASKSEVSVSLSRPGYSSDGRLAIVAFAVGWGRKSAEQDLVILELGTKGWKVTKVVILAQA